MDIQINYDYRKEDLEKLPLHELTQFVLAREDKPFNTEVSISFVTDEAIAELNERYRHKEGPTDVLSFPGLTVSLSQYECHYEGHQVEMPPKELEVLYFLASHVNQVFTREQLLEQVWGFDFFGDSRTVDVHIKRLREKIEADPSHPRYLLTVRGLGYRFVV